MTAQGHALDFSGKVVLVTGGGSGIGAATCRLLSKAGARVIVADRNKFGAEAVAADLPGALAWSIDVTDAQACEAMVAEIGERFGRLDGATGQAGRRGLHGCRW